jgi:cysteinyl-tRNA synthetase
MIKVYNSLTRRKEIFQPLNSSRVGMYVCGVTVYDKVHIGHARAAVVFDFIRRWLERRGYKVFYVTNFTDIDDKIIKKAHSLGISSQEVALRYIQDYYTNFEKLKLRKADLYPKATEHIPEIIKMIKRLIEKGYAYPGEGNVYYRTTKFASYGKLSRQSLSKMSIQEEPAPGKHNPVDFTLWKVAKPGEPSWESPWGKGRPGWHIECSAMAIKYLGKTLDIHGGGQDLIFPHHENEIAQSEAYTGKQFAKYWIHNGMVMVKNEKMAKSLGNIIELSELLKKFSPEAIKLFLLSSHYRMPLNFSQEKLVEMELAQQRYIQAISKLNTLIKLSENQKIEGKVPEFPQEEKKISSLIVKFEEALDDDFNTPEALGVLFTLVKEANAWCRARGEKITSQAEYQIALLMRKHLIDLGEILNIYRSLPSEEIEEIEAIMAERARARAARDWAKADKLRVRLFQKGIIVEDYPQGSVWRRKREGG